MTDWQDISTAPRDGQKNFLAADRWGNIGIGRFHLYYKGRCEFKADFDEYGCGVTDPTHWMPLPQPPKDALL